jgi:hypothetical protein
MKQKHSWEITDEFWAIAEPLIPKKTRDPDKSYQRKTSGGRPPMKPRMALEAIFYVLRIGIHWKALPFPLVLPVPSIAISCFGQKQAFLRLCGLEDYIRMIKSNAPVGRGYAETVV